VARLLEHQGKGLLREAGLVVPAGRLAATAEAAASVAGEIGGPVVVKAQLLAGGRGKAGAVRFADTPAEASQAAGNLLGAVVRGATVDTVLVEERLDIVRELYAGVILDTARDARRPVLMVSLQGGVDVESVPDEVIHRLHVSPQHGLRAGAVAAVLGGAGLPGELVERLDEVCVRLARAHREFDCFALEINPLVVTASGDLVCADCKMQIDNAAVFRHPEMGIEVARDFGHQPTALDLVGWSIEKADLRGSGFVMDMGHDGVSPDAIGFHPIGGGSAMMAMDALSRVGLTPSNYADTSGNPVGSKIYRVAKVVLSQPGIQGYLLGGFMMANQEQWHHAHAVVKALREVLPDRPGFPCVLLVCGNKEEESLAILREGLADCEGASRVEIYGREYVTDTLFIAGRMLALVEEYQAELEGGDGAHVR
jgi:succinyl-CoA synthetase beta subunit